MRIRIAIFLLLIPSVLAQATTGDGNGNAKDRAQGKVTGSYNLLVAGQYSGIGVASVTGSTLSLSATVELSDGTRGALSVSGMTLVNNHFSGTGTVLGSPCTIDGRVDLPAATDDETDEEQATTGRILSTIRDATGKMARVVGIQDEGSRSGGSRGRGRGRSG